MGSREKVLEAATAILGKNGYQATSVDNILDAARVSPSNFYYHWKSKEELAFEVLEGYFERSRQDLSPILVNRSISATEKLKRIHDQIVKRMTASGCCGGCPMGNLAQELSDVHPEFRMRLSRYFDECIEGIAGVVKDGIDAGEFRKDLAPRAAAYLLFGSIQGLTLLSKSMKKVEPFQKGFRQALDLLAR